MKITNKEEDGIRTTIINGQGEILISREANYTFVISPLSDKDRWEISNVTDYKFDEKRIAKLRKYLHRLAKEQRKEHLYEFEDTTTNSGYNFGNSDGNMKVNLTDEMPKNDGSSYGSWSD